MYRLEGKDIVIEGFEKGIADSPYDGIGDMRNMDIVSMPSEAMVNFKETPMSVPPVINAESYTSDPTTDRLTWDGSVSGLYEGCAITLTTTSTTFNYLVVAGGGGGASGGTVSVSPGGGGGAGGMLAGTTTFAPDTYAITVGNGGTGATTSATGTAGGNGGNSSIAALFVATGGGGGAPTALDGAAGGSGGGGGGREGGASGTNGGAGTVGQGNNGGGQTSNQAGAGGGGGAGGVGGSTSNQTGGTAGPGTANSISGASVTYAVGGVGGSGNLVGNGAAGTTNRGNGGGGGNISSPTAYNGGAGGSGVVVISYPTGTVTATGGTITTSGGNTIHTFTSNGNFVVSSGLTSGIVYYVRNIVGNTFQVSTSPFNTVVDITGITAGTFTTYQYGDQRNLDRLSPQSYYVDEVGQYLNAPCLYIVDSSNYAWVCFSGTFQSTIPAYSLIFLGNIGGIGASSDLASIIVWEGYIFLFSNGLADNIDVAEIETFWQDGPVTAWDYGWETFGAPGIAVVLLSSNEDGNLYFSSAEGLGSLAEVPGEDFDPTNTNTYVLTDTAVTVPITDRVICMAELSSNIYIGGISSYIYVWNKLSPGFDQIMRVAEKYIRKIVASDQNLFVFCGNRGRIYISNGATCDIWKKIPDYVTGVVNPYIIWNDASFSRNQLYFSFTAKKNDDTQLTSVNGAWGIDISTQALRMVNRTTHTTYEGVSPMVVEMPLPSTFTSTQVVGSGLVIGWHIGTTTYGIDRPYTEPYTNNEAYMETEMIPVGTYLDPFSPSQIEWKTAVPLGANGTAETIKISWRPNLNSAFVEIGNTSATGTTVTGTTTGTTQNASAISDYYQANFEKAQWIQLKIELSSNATTPTYNRLTELRIRDFTQK